MKNGVNLIALRWKRLNVSVIYQVTLRPLSYYFVFGHQNAAMQNYRFLYSLYIDATKSAKLCCGNVNFGMGVLKMKL